jgi:hypothetical protein
MIAALSEKITQTDTGEGLPMPMPMPLWQTRHFSMLLTGGVLLSSYLLMTHNDEEEQRRSAKFALQWYSDRFLFVVGLTEGSFSRVSSSTVESK